MKRREPLVTPLMSAHSDLADRPSEDVTDVCNISSTDLVADELYSLLNHSNSA